MGFNLTRIPTVIDFGADTDDVSLIAEDFLKFVVILAVNLLNFVRAIEEDVHKCAAIKWKIRDFAVIIG